MQDDFARRVRRLREALGLTQADLAARLGVTATTVHRWERGVYTPTIRTLKRAVEKLEREAGLTN